MNPSQKSYTTLLYFLLSAVTPYLWLIALLFHGYRTRLEPTHIQTIVRCSPSLPLLAITDEDQRLIGKRLDAGRGQYEDAEHHRQRNNWVLMKISDASFLPRTPFPLAHPFTDHVWVMISLSCGDTAFARHVPGPNLHLVAIGPLLIGLYCICIRNKQKTLLYKGRHF